MNTKKRNNMIAVLTVTLMLAVAIVPLAEQDADATGLINSDGNKDDYYKYVLTYTSQAISDVKVFTSEEDTVGASVLGIDQADTFWGFDERGYGPFNSFYAAVNTTTGAIEYHLDPTDLTKSTIGETVNITNGTYSVMWFLPTVYWKADTTTLTLSNKPFTGAVALAHTIDGTVHKYLGYSVYEASIDANDGKLKSVSGVIPTASTTRENFRAAANLNGTSDAENSGDWMLWNYYQWTLYKMCSYTVMGGRDAQLIVGNGTDTRYDSANTTALNAARTGNGNSDWFGASVARSGNNSFSKLFIENSWGSVWEFVDDIAFNYQVVGHDTTTDTDIHAPVMYAGQNSLEGKSWCDKAYAQYSGEWAANSALQGTVYLPAFENTDNWNATTNPDGRANNARIGDVWKSNEAWDLPKTLDSSGYDAMWENNGDRLANVGGSWGDGASVGVSALFAYGALSYSYALNGARLAYILDADPAATGYYVNTNHSNLTTTYSAVPNAALAASSKIYSNGDNIVLRDLGFQSIVNQVDNEVYIYKHKGWAMTADNNVTGANLLAKNAVINHEDSVDNGVVKTIYSVWEPAIRVIDPNNVGPITHSSSIGTTPDGYFYIVSDVNTWPYVGESGWTTAVTENGQSTQIPSFTNNGYTVVNSNTFYRVGEALPALNNSINVFSTWLQTQISITFVSTITEQTICTMTIPKGTYIYGFDPTADNGLNSGYGDIFSFEGWFYDSACTHRCLFDKPFYQNTVLYASAIEYLRFTSSPNAAANVTPSNIDISTFLFDATLSDNAYKVKWDFGDGNSSEDKFVYHTYAKPGHYTATLTVENYGGEQSTTTYEIYNQTSEKMSPLMYIVTGIILAIILIAVGTRLF